MDAERLEEIKAREQAATPGPWEVVHNVDDYGRPEQWVFFNSHEEMERDSTVLNVANAEFIAHSREDMPAVIEALEAERREAEERIRQLEEEVKDLRDELSLARHYILELGGKITIAEPEGHRSLGGVNRWA
jgi:multidrug resistance efflux pump